MKWEIVKNVNDAKKKLFPIPLPFANRANAKEEGLVGSGCPIGTNTCIKLLISPVEAVGLKREEGLYLQVKLEQDKKKRREYGLAGKKRNGDFYQTYDWA